MKGGLLSPTCIWLIARNTLLEAARQKLFNFLLVLALALVAGVQGFRDFNFGVSELKFLTDFGFGAMAFFGSALTVVATAQLFFSEIELRTAQTLLAKPVRRADFILGKYLGVLAVVAIFCALLAGLLGGVLWAREGALMREFPGDFPRGSVLDFGALAAAAVVQWLKLAVLAAFTLLVASFSQTQLYTVVNGFFVLVICHLQYLAHDAYARAGTMGGKSIASLVTFVFPNFQLFNLADELTPGVALPWGRIASLSLYAFGYIAAACALTVYSFRKREI